MLTERQRLGVRGEAIAGHWLEAHGWEILDRRFRSGHRDLDLVAARAESGGGRMVAFVEVRTRISLDLGTPAETVQWRKQQQLARSARAWIGLNRRSGDNYRFDVLGVLVEGERTRIQYVPDAFWLRSFG
ncbi:MAG: YraN family protein [Gemmatimonadaceae bacterium]